MIPNIPQIGKIKNFIEEHLEKVIMPPNGKDVILVKETGTGKNYGVEVGVGKSWRYPAYWDLIGHVYSDESGKFSDGSIRTPKKLPRSTKVACGLINDGFYNKIKKAAIGFSDLEWNNTLDDLVKFLEDSQN